MGRPPKKQTTSFLEKIKPEHGLELQKSTRNAVVIILLIAAGIVSLLSLLGEAGTAGTWILLAMRQSVGVLSLFIPLLFFLLAFALVLENQIEVEKESYTRLFFGSFLALGALAGLIHLFYITPEKNTFDIAQAGTGGGYLGLLFSGPLFYLLQWAAAVVLAALLLLGIIIALNTSLRGLYKSITNIFKRFGNQEYPGLQTEAQLKQSIKSSTLVQKPVSEQPAEVKINIPGSAPMENTPTAPKKKKVANPASSEPITLPDSVVIEDRTDWQLPPFDMLDKSSTSADSGNVMENVEIIRKTLADFGIEVEMDEVNVGPTVTQYTLRPATGVKLAQINSLRDDLALALAAQAIRLELPIPGKALVGIEVPNQSKALVTLREVMQTSEFVNHPGRLALALGRDVAGKPMIVDLAKMPHLLIAGATGTGKSVAINSLLISLLYRNTPQDVKLICIDPKRVEMSLYNGIPHLLTKVVIESDKAVNSLKWAVAEMDRRYRLLSEAGKRNIAEYNQVTELKLHYIVIVVDELADLMAVAQQEVEGAIVRLAQMARAVGIHLVLATQRPSVEVITGLIKANITARIAFAVASQVDSRTILDASGAEKLLGNGDMLFTSAEFNKPKRLQGAYVAEPEVKRVSDFFKKQAGAVLYNDEVTETPAKGIGAPSGSESGAIDDELYEEAKAEVIRAGKASVSFLQRRLRVGYARAARLIDLLEDNGVVSAGDGAKPREVYGDQSALDDENSELAEAEHPNFREYN